jgi:hypothetical protein
MNIFLKYSVYMNAFTKTIAHDPHPSHSFTPHSHHFSNPHPSPAFLAAVTSPSPFRRATPRTSLRNAMCLVYSQP